LRLKGRLKAAPTYGALRCTRVRLSLRQGRSQYDLTDADLQAHTRDLYRLRHQTANIGIVESGGGLVEADRADLVAAALEARFGIVERDAFEEEEPDPTRIEDDREHRVAALGRGESNAEQLASLEDQQPRAGIAFSQLLQRGSRRCGNGGWISVDGFVEIRLFRGHERALLNAVVLREIRVDDAEGFVRERRTFVEHRDERLFPLLRRTATELDAIEVVAHGAGVEHDLLAGAVRNRSVVFGKIADENGNIVLRDL